MQTLNTISCRSKSKIKKRVFNLTVNNRLGRAGSVGPSTRNYFISDRFGFFIAKPISFLKPIPGGGTVRFILTQI